MSKCLAAVLGLLTLLPVVTFTLKYPTDFWLFGFGEALGKRWLALLGIPPADEPGIILSLVMFFLTAITVSLPLMFPRASAAAALATMVPLVLSLLRLPAWFGDALFADIEIRIVGSYWGAMMLVSIARRWLRCMTLIDGVKIGLLYIGGQVVTASTLGVMLYMEPGASYGLMALFLVISVTWLAFTIFPKRGSYNQTRA